MLLVLKKKSHTVLENLFGNDNIWRKHINKDSWED